MSPDCDTYPPDGGWGGEEIFPLVELGFSIRKITKICYIVTVTKETNVALAERELCRMDLG